MQENRSSAIEASVLPSESKASWPAHPETKRCQILAKKGFLTAKKLKDEVALIIYSSQFQLGVLLHLGEPARENLKTNEFAEAAISMVLTEFETLGERNSDLNVYAIGGSTGIKTKASLELMIRRYLWDRGLNLTASDLGGYQTRSIWLDVETGRLIIRSEIPDETKAEASQPIQFAS